jgi:hypothetical protein
LHEGLEQALRQPFDLLVALLQARDREAADGIDRHEVGGGGIDRKSLHVAAETLRDQLRGLQHRLHRGMIFGRNQDRFHGVRVLSSNELRRFGPLATN